MKNIFLIITFWALWCFSVWGQVNQAYFVNIPSKFISPDGQTMWLMYSGNFATNWNNEQIKPNPPGSHYGLVMQKIQLI